MKTNAIASGIDTVASPDPAIPPQGDGDFGALIAQGAFEDEGGEGTPTSSGRDFIRLAENDPAAAADRAADLITAANEEDSFGLRGSNYENFGLLLGNSGLGTPDSINAETMDAFQDSIRVAFYAGDLSANDLASFVQNYSSFRSVGSQGLLGADIGREAVLGTDNASLIKDVGLELYGRASRNDTTVDADQNEAQRTDDYTAAFQFLDRLEQFGDTTVSGRVMSDLWGDADSMRLAVDGALNPGAPGAMDFLAGQTVLRHEAGLISDDLADEVFQSILVQSENGALLQSNDASRGQIYTYLLQEFDRIVDEAAYPLSGTDTRSMAERELNDEVFFEQIVSTIIFNPLTSDSVAETFSEKYNDKMVALAEIVNDPNAEDGVRTTAAFTFGFARSAYEEGYDHALASQTTFSEVVTTLVGFGFSFVGADIRNKVLQNAVDEIITTISIEGKARGADIFADTLSQVLSERREAADLASVEWRSATFPDPKDSDPGFATEIRSKIVAGESAAAAARDDLAE